jgi:hypothetical protein
LRIAGAADTSAVVEHIELSMRPTIQPTEQAAKNMSTP